LDLSSDRILNDDIYRMWQDAESPAVGAGGINICHLIVNI